MKQANFESVKRTENSITIINQTRLPLNFEHKQLSDYKEIINSIKRLEVRGAPAIGIAAAYGLAIAVQQKQQCDLEYLNRAAVELKASRPTAVNLSWAIDRMMNKFKSENPGGLDSALEVLWAEAEAIHEEDKKMCEHIGTNGASLINQGDHIITYCNTGILATGGIGTALGIIYTCHKQNKNNKIFVCETRPLLQGARLTAWELSQVGIDVTLIADNTAGALMLKNEISSVIVGADRITKNGDVVNKIGTYSLAVLAEKHNIPFYVAAPSSTFDNQSETGSEIEIEERQPEEITNGFGEQTTPSDIRVFSPAFDITPKELISKYITDRSILPGKR